MSHGPSVSGSYRLHDTSLLVSWPGIIPMFVAADQRAFFDGLLGHLRKRGFRVGRDPSVRFRSLWKDHKAGRKGDLQFAAHVYTTGFRIDFFQEVVAENPNGGRYDFGKRGKMPYLIGKAFELALRDCVGLLRAAGFVERTSVESANPDPLAYFNDRWDSEYEKEKGIHRFKRGDDGWPHPDELRGYGSRADADGRQIGHGEWRHFRRNGYLMRGRVYGGINGRWLVVYGPGRQDFTHLSSFELFTAPAGAERRLKTVRVERLRKELKLAVGREDFERAIVLRDLIGRIESAQEAGKLAA